MHGTVSSKMFLFLFGMLIASGLLLLKNIVKFSFHVCLSIIDGLLLLWVVYVLLNGTIQQMSVSNRLLELFGLILFYIILRQVKPSHFGILLMAMIIGSTVQAIWGNLQLWGYLSSMHILFPTTGSFLNPAPFAGYLASAFPAISGLLLYKIPPLNAIDEKINQSLYSTKFCASNRFIPLHFIITRCVAAISIIVILSIIIPAQSRASWISICCSSFFLFLNRYSIIQWIKNQSLLKRNTLILLLCIIVGAGLFGLWGLKPYSANGRLFVWKITNNIIIESPFWGVGYNKFNSHYMTEQARFFEKMPNSPEAMLADDVYYAFNDFLQHTAENGLVGLVLILFVFVAAFRVSYKPFDNLIWIAKSGIIGIVVFALFSYPSDVLPVKMNLTLYLACLSLLSEKKTLQIKMLKYIPVKFALFLCIVFGLFAGYKHLAFECAAWKNWNIAYRLYSINRYTDSLPYYRNAWPVLKKDGDYLTNYGKALSMAGLHEQATDVLQQATLYYPNTVLFISLGDSYKSLNNMIAAEQAYSTAWYMNPSRFYPKYLLAKLYDETGQIKKAITTAHELLNKEVKVVSTAIDEMRREMEAILVKYQQLDE